MESFVDQAVRILSNIPVETVLQALAAGGVLALIVQKLKKWLEIQSSGVINFVNGILAFTVVAVQNLMSAVPANPSQLPGKALALMSIIIAAYHAPVIGIKSLSQLTSDVKETRERKARVAETPEIPEVPLETVQPQVPIAVAPVTPDEFA